MNLTTISASDLRVRGREDATVLFGVMREVFKEDTRRDEISEAKIDKFASWIRLQLIEADHGMRAQGLSDGQIEVWYESCVAELKVMIGRLISQIEGPQ